MLIVIAAVSPPAEADSFDACVRQLRRAVTSQRDGSHLPCLFALRQLHDPTLRPLFLQLAQRDEWQVQVHAILGHAEIETNHRVDPWLVTRVDELAQEVLIANAIDMDLIGLEEIEDLIAYEELQPMPRLLLMGELLLRHQPLDQEALSKLAMGPNYRVAGLASLFLAQLGDNSALGAFNDRLSGLPKRERNRYLLWLLDAIRQYRITAAQSWVARLLEAPDTDDDLAYWGTFTVLILDPRDGVPLWERRVGSDPPYRDQVRYGMLLLAAGRDVPASAYDRLETESELVRRMADAGKALSAGKDPTDQLIALLDLGHLKTSKWAMGVLEELPPDQAAKVYLHIIENVESNRAGQAERVARAIEAAAKLFERKPELVAQLLTRVEDDSLTQETLLLGLFDSPSPAAGHAAQHVRRIGAGRADSLALLLSARHADSLNENDLRQLGMIAAGGGRVSEGLQIQAAWLYLKHSKSIERALNLIFNDSP